MVRLVSSNGFRAAALHSNQFSCAPSIGLNRFRIVSHSNQSIRCYRQPTSHRQQSRWQARLRTKETSKHPMLRRNASTDHKGATPSPQVLQASYAGRGLMLGLSTAILATFGYLYFTDTRASIHRWLLVPTIRWVFPDAEDAHHAGIEALKISHLFGLNPRERGDQDRSLEVEVFGHKLRNPLAVSAGLDKNGEVIDPLFELGPAIVEIGGITPLPQPGNEKPRVWRVVSQSAMINRYGLNSKGAVAVARDLRQRVREYAKSQGYGFDEEAETKVLNGEAGVPPGSLRPGKLLAVQIAKNKATPDTDFEAVKSDYVKCVQQLGKYADIIVVNVSSPNTPGLRNLQQAQPLKVILGGVVQAANSVSRKTKPAVMVKVSPDESNEEDILSICEVVWDTGVDGVIVANTTKSRPLAVEGVLTTKEAETLKEFGGYSGPALFNKTHDLVKRYRHALDTPLREGNSREPQKTIFASGGITTGEDVLKVCNAGASVAMSYTGMVYYGSGYFSALKSQIRDKIRDTVASRAQKEA